MIVAPSGTKQLFESFQVPCSLLANEIVLRVTGVLEYQFDASDAYKVTICGSLDPVPPPVPTLPESSLIVNA